MKSVSMAYAFITAIILTISSATAKEISNKTTITTVNYNENPQPIDETIALAAPHLPVVKKYEGFGTPFKYRKAIYTYEKDIIYTWIKDYPLEFDNYKIAMKALLKQTKVSQLSPTMQSIFFDLKAQYYMIKTFNK